MQYKDSDAGPCYFSADERKERKLDIASGKKRDKIMTKSILIQKLKDVGITNPSGTRSELQSQCISLGIPVKVEEQVIIEGWMRKQKGAMQILYERGWLNPEHLSSYTADGKRVFLRLSVQVMIFVTQLGVIIPLEGS